MNILLSSQTSFLTFILYLFASFFFGYILSLVYMYQSQYSKSFVLTLMVLPTSVAVVIMLVNGNIGTGVAIAGAFSLVRFRSIAGNARDILMIFIAMTIGLLVGMGYLMYAVIFVGMTTGFILLLTYLKFGEKKNAKNYRILTITIPEELNYPSLFEDIFQEYTISTSLLQVKTTNMGSLYKLSYEILMKDNNQQKQMIDMLRTRNGNLEIALNQKEISMQEL